MKLDLDLNSDIRVFGATKNKYFEVYKLISYFFRDGSFFMYPRNNFKDCHFEFIFVYPYFMRIYLEMH